MVVQRVALKGSSTLPANPARALGTFHIPRGIATEAQALEHLFQKSVSSNKSDWSPEKSLTLTQLRSRK